LRVDIISLNTEITRLGAPNLDVEVPIGAIYLGVPGRSAPHIAPTLDVQPPMHRQIEAGTSRGRAMPGLPAPAGGARLCTLRWERKEEIGQDDGRKSSAQDASRVATAHLH